MSDARSIGNAERQLAAADVGDLAKSSTPPARIAGVLRQKYLPSIAGMQDRIVYKLAQRQVDQAGFREAPRLRSSESDHHLGDDAFRKLDSQTGSARLSRAADQQRGSLRARRRRGVRRRVEGAVECLAVRRESAATHVGKGAEVVAVVLRRKRNVVALCCAITPSVAVSYSVNPAMNREPSGAIESTVDWPVTVRLRRIEPEAVSYTNRTVEALLFCSCR